MKDVLTIPTAMAIEKNNNLTATIKSISRRLLSFIRQRVTNEADAEDILQDVFYQFAGSTEPIEQASGWLYRVAKNKITDSYRKKKLPLAEDIFTPGSLEDDMPDWKEMVLSADGTPETEYLRNLFWEELQHALDEVPEEQRMVFIQNEIEGLSFKDISEQTKVPIATLISRKRYAVLHLRSRLATLREEIINY
ncbi:MAG: sigma-70 family RNA polymerase sigma factor [Bacteroidetes bacterium]|nr:sigma-70 family RNA polymerase sigma factor [Bacteroidota bacterium]MBS1757824.1 sigma-70 family RNA polymerase sigma factor [Bacteroidota bacterium]